ncbi:MAG: accessory factor UbiK family protein [Rhodospirillales bacterium]|nr:accessory factor UbiK family protein [Rhodospirillales bacterium]
MQTSNRILDDMAKMASGAVSAVTGLKGDAEGILRRQMEKLLADMNLVSREEFDAVKAMAAKARSEQEKLEARVAELETQLKSEHKSAKKKS